MDGFVVVEGFGVGAFGGRNLGFVNPAHVRDGEGERFVLRAAGVRAPAAVETRDVETARLGVVARRFSYGHGHVVCIALSWRFDAFRWHKTQDGNE